MAFFVDDDVAFTLEQNTVKQLYVPQEPSHNKTNLWFVQQTRNLGHVDSPPECFSHHIPIVLVSLVHPYEAVVILLGRDNDLHLTGDFVIAAVHASRYELV